MRIMVTGGAGFIGSNLVDALIEKEHEVIVVDNLSAGRKENINPKAKFYNLDILDKSLSEIFEKEKPEIISHHAAQIDVRVSLEDPILDASTNILGLLNLLQNSIKYKVKKFIFSSSAGVYGDVDSAAKETDPVKPLSHYSVSKLAAENYLRCYSNLFGLKYTILRYSNVYGPRQESGEAGVISIFVKKMLENKQPTVFGDGNQTRDYVFVKDVVKANMIVLEKGDNQIFNIGTGIPTSVNDAFNLIKKQTNYEGNPAYKDSRPGEINSNYLDCSKSYKEIGWKAETKLEQGITKTLAYVKNHTLKRGHVVSVTSKAQLFLTLKIPPFIGDF